jgi:hypothetical protein
LLPLDDQSAIQQQLITTSLQVKMKNLQPRGANDFQIRFKGTKQDRTKEKGNVGRVGLSGGMTPLNFLILVNILSYDPFGSLELNSILIIVI